MDWVDFTFGVLHAMFIIGVWELGKWLRTKFKRKPWQYVVRNTDPKPMAAALRDLAYKIGEGKFTWESGGILINEITDGRWIVKSDLVIRPVTRCEQ